jgi:hypothetical protein
LKARYDGAFQMRLLLRVLLHAPRHMAGHLCGLTAVVVGLIANRVETRSARVGYVVATFGALLARTADVLVN